MSGFRAATRGATLSFVGLLAAVSLQFAQSIQWTVARVALGTAALVALRLKTKIIWVVLASAAIGMYSG